MTHNDITQNEPQRGKRGAGRLYKRDSSGKEHKADDKVHGAFWLEYRVNGKRVRQRLLDENGKSITTRRKAEKARRQIMEPFTTADEAEQLRRVKAKLSEAEEAHAQAMDIVNPPLGIGEAWEAFLGSRDAPETGEDTLKYYAGYWKKFSEWLGGKHPEVACLRDISQDMGVRYADVLLKKGLSPNTFNKHVGFLRLFFRVLKEEARVGDNPFDKIRRRKLKTNSRRELTIAELKAILDKADGELKTLLMLGTFTGLRLGDCATLKWGEVDLLRLQVKRVPNKLRHRDKAKPVIVGIHPALFQELSGTPAKERKGYVLPFFAELYTYRGRSGRPTKQPEISKQIQEHFLDTCSIQIHKEGTGYELEPCKYSSTGYKKVHTGKRAVVEVGFHSLRHSFVSLQAEAGTPMAVVQAIVGHGSPAMTAHYTHIGETAAKQAALAMPSDIVDAEFEVLDDPLPLWAVELIEGMDADCCEKVKLELLKRGRR